MVEEQVVEPGEARSGPTVSHVLGEIAWLLSQSPLHRALPIEALEWLAMPALIHRQFYIFRDADKPVGVAFWAGCGPVAERKLQGGMIEPENRLTLDEWASGEDLWLVDLVAPFATEANRQREIMIADLICGPLLGRAFKFHQLDPDTGRRVVRSIEADAAERLREAVAAANG